MFLLEVFVINQLGKVSTFSGGLKWTHSFSASNQDSVLRWLPMFYSNQREWAVYFVCLNIHFHVEQVSLVVLWGTLTLREDFKWFVWPHVQQTLSFSLFFFSRNVAEELFLQCSKKNLYFFCIMESLIICNMVWSFCALFCIIQEIVAV